jgi:two-component system response regulator HupR/HoxA
MDIVVLANSILKENSLAFNKPASGFTQDTLGIMQKYSWPGNVRELQNVIQHMLVFAKGDILGADLLPRKILFSHHLGKSGGGDTGWMSDIKGSLKERVATLESIILQESLIRHHWNKSKAARELGISRVGLRSKLDRYSLKKPTS